MDDRIVNQLMYIPKNYNELDFQPDGRKSLKLILLSNGNWNDLPLGRKKFLDDKCPVNACFLVKKQNLNLQQKADAVIFKDHFLTIPIKRPKDRPKQVWIQFLLESPINTDKFRNMPKNSINWTATYRLDSDIVAPYEKFVSYETIFKFNNIEPPIRTPLPSNQNGQEKTTFNKKKSTINYAAGKTKKVAWFVSNCYTINKRLDYARELSKYIDVDIYGNCGNLNCPRWKANECFDMLNRDYKFYLAFENSNCQDYITEKFFQNGLGHNSDKLNILPIVMGAHPFDYRRAAPKNSFLHVDWFESPKELASYLNYLDKNDNVYNEYFQWKSKPKDGEFINTYFWCRICTLLHSLDDDDYDQTSLFDSYDEFSHWWGPDNGVCPAQQTPIFRGKPTKSS